MYLKCALNDAPEAWYLGTSTMEQGIWYCPGPGVPLSNFLPLFSVPNLNRGPSLSFFES